jgi:hypothetical protein
MRDRVEKERSLLRDTRAIDTVPMKIILYLAVTGVILMLVTVSWNSVSSCFTGYRVEEQINDLSVELLSIQKGYARNLEDKGGNEGSMCTVRVSLPENIRFLAFGVDPDPDIDGNISNSAWLPENNTLLVQYNNGQRNRFIIKGEEIRFRKGTISEGTWVLDPYSVQDNMGIVIKEPVNGDYTFELAFSGEKYTLSHF